MKRKSECPVCGKIFVVTPKRISCCCDEHKAIWVKMQDHARKQRRIKGNDLDWANSQLEMRLEEVANLKAENAILKMKKICAENAETPQNGQKVDEETQKPTPKSEKIQKIVENAQKSALAVEKIKRTTPNLRQKRL